MSPHKDPMFVNLVYVGTAAIMGSLSCLASLLGNDQPLSIRNVLSYVLAGGIVSAAVVLVTIDKFGASYFTVGLSIFAGYKAFDVLALGGNLGKAVIEVILKASSDKKP